MADISIGQRPNTFLQRLVGAAALDAAIYEEVEADPSATAQAMVIVVVSSLATGIGVRGLSSSPASVTFFTIVALLSWAAWALVMCQVGLHVLPGPETKTNVGELLRTLGFAATPGIVTILGVVPEATLPVFALAGGWMLMAMVVAVRQALDYTSTARAVLVCVLGAVLAIIVAVTLGTLFGPTVS